MIEIVQITAAGVVSFGFGVLYNVRGKRLIVSALGGILCWGTYLLLNIFSKIYLLIIL